MKNKFLRFFGIITLLLIWACATEKEQMPLPELTYFGEEPRIQNPLSPEESQRHIQLPKGFTAELFAAEPNIINPIAFAWDERGRLWVLQSQDYPHDLENDVGGDRITICEDIDKDGLADKFTEFAVGQSLSTGIVIVKGGAIVSQAPEMVFLEDSDGDDKMDKRTVLFDGFGIWDTHAGPSSLRFGHDNMIWGAVGYSGFENQFVGKPVEFSTGVFRFSREGDFFEPVGKFNNNTWGLGISQDLEIFGSTANNNHACYVGIPLKYYDYLNKRPTWGINSDFIQGHYEISAVGSIPLQQVDVRGGYTAAAGANFYTAENYPKAYQNQMYVNAPTGHLVHIARMEKSGAGYKEVDGGNIFASTDAWAAPVFTETGPDGNLWVADWYNPVIQHNPDKRGMDNQIWNDEPGEGNAHLNPHRDKRHGRIYVIKYKGKADNSIASLDPSDDNGLLAGIKSSNMFWRTTAQRLIVENSKTELIPQLIKIAGGDNLPAVHALWSLNGLGAFNSDSNAQSLINKALTSSSSVVKKTGLALLPSTEKSSIQLAQSMLLEDPDLFVRRNAILKASELPETEELFHATQHLLSNEINSSDQWLIAAIKLYNKDQNIEEIEPEEVDMVIASGDEEITDWKYTEEAVDNWNSVDFDDSNWEVGASVFGTKDLSENINTTWSSGKIWLRRDVDLEERITNPVLKVIHDENYEVYVNGRLLFQEKGRTRKYKLIRLDSKLGKLFKKGKNVIAVYCQNENGNQYIDVGIGNAKQFEADQTIVLNTVPQKMAYDRKEIHAMAGQTLEIVLNNIDQMPHNLVLIDQGSLEVFGKTVDQFLQSPEAAEMEYVPQSRYVLGATKMLDPEESGSIKIRVPDNPGDYPFICTFPGHWRMMQGVLKVSARGSYFAENPNAIKVAVMGGGGSHNFEKFFGIADGKIMSQGGKNEINYTESPMQLTSLLMETDVLVISNNKPYNADTKEAIFTHVDQGKPMLIYHPSTWYNWKDWPEYNKDLVAGGSRSHEKLQEFEVIVKKPNHPIMKNVPPRFRVTDELYRWEKDPEGPKVEVLAIGKGLESGAEYPVVWIVKHDKAPIVCNTLGHDQDAHGLPAYQNILENSFNWITRKLKRPL